MQLDSTTKQDFLIVTVREDRIDAAAALSFKDAMRRLTTGHRKKVILDLHAVDFVDSSGLGAIVGSMKALGSGRKMILAGLTPTVDKVFRLTRMDSVFQIFGSLDDALGQMDA